VVIGEGIFFPSPIFLSTRAGSKTEYAFHQAHSLYRPMDKPPYPLRHDPATKAGERENRVYDCRAAPGRATTGKEDNDTPAQSQPRFRGNTQ